MQFSEAYLFNFSHVNVHYYVSKTKHFFTKWQNTYT